MIRVLVIEDRPLFRAGLSHVIRGERGMTVAGELSSCADAVERTADADLLLVTVRACRRRGLAALMRQTTLPVLVLHDPEDRDLVRALLRMGVQGIVCSSSSSETLLRALRALWEGLRFIDPADSEVLIDSFVATGHEGGPRDGARRWQASSAQPAPLTRREREVCRLVALGYTNLEVSRLLTISLRTVEGHRRKLMRKLGLTTRASLVRYAIDNGLLEPADPIELAMVGS